MILKSITYVMLSAIIATTTPDNSLFGSFDHEVQQVCDVQEIISVREITSLVDINALKVNAEVKYDVDVTPPTTFYYTKVQNGIRYGGTLNIVSIRYRSDANYALYSGYIYPLEWCESDKDYRN